MKRTFLVTYTTVSGQTYTEFKTFENGPEYDTCVSRIIDEFDELPYLFIKKYVIHYINVDHIESLDIEEVSEGQNIVYDFD